MQVQHASRPKRPDQFRHCPPLVHEVQGHAAQDVAKVAVRERQAIAGGADERNGLTFVLGNAAAKGECGQVAVEADVLGRGEGLQAASVWPAPQPTSSTRLVACMLSRNGAGTNCSAFP